jgi:glycosyltransferase involved in cell wall biosynthesis
MVHHARAVQPHAIQRAEAIIAISDFTRREIVEVLGLPAERVDVIPLGVSGRFFAPPSAEELADLRRRLGLEREFILHVGVLSPRKNLVRLMHAYRRLRADGLIAHQLILAGSRGWRDEEIVREAGAIDPSGQDIRLIGQVADGDLPALYHLAELFVFPSLYEGFGIPPLEAMARGTPVVSSNAAALPEVVGDAAELVDPLDEVGLAEAIKRVLTNASRREELTIRGRERAARFSWEQTARRTLAVYERVASAADGEQLPELA